VAIGEGEDAVPSLTGDCTELPTATGTGEGGSLDLTGTRGPKATFTGTPPVIEGGGPGPAGPRVSGTGTGSLPGQPTSDPDENTAGRAAEVGFGVLVALAVVNGLAWML
jgi:hypothetical protein